MINKLNSKIRVREIDTASDKIIETFDRESNNQLKGDPTLSVVFDEMRRLSQEITDSLHKETIKGLEELDKRRDDAIRNLSNALTGYSSLPLPNLATPAKKLKKAFDKFGVKITRMAFSEESSEIESLLSEFSKNEMRDACNQLQGVPECVNILRDAENDFKKLWLENNDMRIGFSDNALRPAVAVKKDLLQCINNKLVGFLNAMLAVNQPKYVDFANQVGGIIQQFNQTVVNREEKNDESSASADEVK